MSKRKNYLEETIERFEKFIKGEELNVNIYDIGYCPVCNKARIVHFYSPISGTTGVQLKTEETGCVSSPAAMIRTRENGSRL